MLKRRWEKENFVTLINKLNKNFNNVEVIIFSGPDEEVESRDVSLATNSLMLLNLSFNELTKEISKCNIFINTDSGLGHIASCLSI